MPAVHTRPKVKAPRAGKVPARWIRTASDELAIRKGYCFDERFPALVARFLREHCRHSKDTPYTRAGDPFELLDWQYEGVVAPLYGWRRPDRRRRFEELYCQVAKKNGKSTLISGLGLNHLVADKVAVPEVYLLGVDRPNAGSIYDECERMVDASPALGGILRTITSRKTIVYEAKHGRLLAESKEVASKEGRGPSVVVFDELHLHRDSRMWRIFRYAMRARPEPLTIVITTAGTAEDVERRSICYRRYEYAKGILSGKIRDLRVLPYVREADPSDPIDKRATWAKANPSLGVTLRADDFKSDLAEARHDPEALNEFKQKRLNIWVSSDDRYIDSDDWQACAGRDGPLDLLARNAGRPFHGGLDLASVRDLAAFAALFPQDDGGLDLYVKFWCPAGSIDRRSRSDAVNYRAWSEAGWIEALPGRRIDQWKIREWVKGFCATHECRSLDVDPWQAHMLLGVLTGEDKLPATELKQSVAYLNEPTRELLGLVLEGKLRHGGHPVLAWNAGNLRVYTDENGNIKPSRKRSPEKIDGISATIDAIYGWLDARKRYKPSVYETRGIEVIDL